MRSVGNGADQRLLPASFWLPFTDHELLLVGHNVPSTVGNVIAVGQWWLACGPHFMYLRSRRGEVYKGVIAGALGGLAASWIMPRFQFLVSHALSHADPHEGQEEDATVKTAQGISSALLGHELSEEEKKRAGPFVHYAYGTGIGALYGGLAQRHETVTWGFGSAYGTAVWALGDEIAVPALRLGNTPAETPLSQHLQLLVAHLVYGITLEGVRRLASWRA